MKRYPFPLWSAAIASTFTVCIISAQSSTPAKAAAGSQEKEYTIKTTSRLVLLDVSVKDPKGGYVSGLTKDNFHVFEDGKPQEISQFANSDIPVSIGILVDESGSMRPKKPEIITAALSFISASNPKDEIFVINFNEKVRRGLPDTELFSDNIQQLRSALWSGIPEGRTALYDAVVAGLKQLEMGRRDKKSLVLISDGGDNVSTANEKDVMKLVLESIATIYTIGVYSPDDPDKNPDLLKRLAQISGGAFYQPPKLEDIVPECKKIAQDVRTRYTIGYVPSVEGKEIRHIKVTTSVPDRGRLIVRTRTSYMMNENSQAADRKAGQ